MASRVLIKGRHVVSYLPNLCIAVRCFASYKEPSSANYFYVKARKIEWPDKNLGPFGPVDSRFPLPGSIGVVQDVDPPTIQIVQPKLEPSTISDRHEAIGDQLLEYSAELNDPINPMPTATDMLECVAIECPQTLAKDFTELFPGQHGIRDKGLTVITISQKTENDMSTWSEAVESEREALLETFIQGACEICTVLNQAGYWADFIDPSCGKPFLGKHTNFSLHETDERYRSLGFHIEDLGCCKVICHHIWGTHAYVGCLFTNAPIDHPVIKTMRQNYVPEENTQ